MNLAERIAEMARDNAISPDPNDWRIVKRKAREVMKVPADWAFTPKGNAVVVQCKGPERGLAVMCGNGVIATRVLLAAIDAYDQEMQRLEIIKSSHERISAKRVRPMSSPLNPK